MSIFNLLKRKKKFENRPDSNPIKNITPMIEQQPDPILQMIAGIPDNLDESQQLNTYDILVFDPNQDGTMKQKMVSGVKAASPQALAAMYTANGSKIQILKEYKTSVPNQEHEKSKQYKQSNHNAVLNFKQINNDENLLKHSIKEPPKFFEIGGIRCKLEDGKMFQEQWVKVDSTKYRLIADASNKICPMTGKHLETLKWIQIENTEENDGNGEENA